MEYFLISTPNPKTLTDDVNDMIKLGWMPYGDLKVATLPPNREMQSVLFVQAMLKREPNEAWPVRP